MANETKLTNLVDPEVMADLVQKKLCNNIVFLPAAEVDTTLVGRPGDTLSMPAFSYVGQGAILGEASEITYSVLNESTVSVKVSKVVKGVNLTDESLLSGFGSPYDEAAKQIALALDDKIDDQMLGVLGSIASNMTYETSTSTTALKPEDVNNALELFGEDFVGQKLLYVSPAFRTKLSKASDWLPASKIAADMMVKGVVGEIYGCQVIVTNRLKDNSHDYSEKAYIVKPGALRLIMKREAFVETARDLDHFCNKIAGSIHEACYLYDSSKAIKLQAKS